MGHGLESMPWLWVDESNVRPLSNCSFDLYFSILEMKFDTIERNWNHLKISFGSVFWSVMKFYNIKQNWSCIFSRVRPFYERWIIFHKTISSESFWKNELYCKWCWRNDSEVSIKISNGSLYTVQNRLIWSENRIKKYKGAEHFKWSGSRIFWRQKALVIKDQWIFKISCVIKHLMVN